MTWGAKCEAQMKLETWRTGFLHWDDNWKLANAAQCQTITVILQCLNLTLSNTGVAIH